MANHISVPVTYDSQENKLKLSPNQELIVLENSDDWVSWHLENTPTGDAKVRLAILFDPPLGPFQTVQSFNDLTLAAKGNQGPPQGEEFEYFLYLIPANLTGQEELITGGPFTVKNQSPAKNTSPWLKLVFSEDSQGNKRAEIQPQHLLLFEGDVAFWETSQLDEDHVVAFRFQDEPHFPGPFPTYFATRAGGSGIHRLGLATFGNVTGSFPYDVKVWDKNGHPVEVVGDPSVDSLGKPPGT